MLVSGRSFSQQTSLWQQVVLAGSLAISALVLASCEAYTKYHPFGALAEVRHAEAELAREQAAFVRQYRECLAKKEANPQVDCSEYRTAVEVIEKTPSK